MATTTLAEGEADAREAIRLAPTHAENWMLLAYQYTLADRGTSPRVIAAVRQSYAASPLAQDVSAYRLSFVFRGWSSLPSDVQDLARDEARQFGTTNAGQVFLQKAVPAITDQKARFEFAVITMVAGFQLSIIDLTRDLRGDPARKMIGAVNLAELQRHDGSWWT